MKIIIVGGGISGLTTYLFLKQHLPNPAPPAKPHEIVIYENHDASKKLERQYFTQDAAEQTTNTIAIGGGLGLGPNGLNVLKRLDKNLFRDVVREGHSITKWVMTCARGWTLTSIGIRSEDDPPMNSVMIGRQMFWHCIRQYVPDEVIVKKKISKVKGVEGQRPVVFFADGTPDEECDLVLGCDGLRSIVRAGIFEDEPGKEKYPPHYE
jgi:2-polyprenyl-6-methoxyphenol hydroxylase-like FAD-dependent oxidoreductase